jgi:hypothetical protein
MMGMFFIPNCIGRGLRLPLGLRVVVGVFLVHVTRTPRQKNAAAQLLFLFTQNANTARALFTTYNLSHIYIYKHHAHLTTKFAASHVGWF